MKRSVIVAVLFALSANVALAAPTPAPTASAKPSFVKKFVVAPADEYFGRLKMSILGIRNTIKDLGLKADADPSKADAIAGPLALCEDAIHDWEKKYPADGWIPGAIFGLERLYARIDRDDARQKAVRTMTWLVHDYPKHALAAQGRRELSAHLVGARPSPEPSAEPLVEVVAPRTADVQPPQQQQP